MQSNRHHASLSESIRVTVLSIVQQNAQIKDLNAWQVILCREEVGFLNS